MKETEFIFQMLKAVSAASSILSYNVRNADSETAVYLNISRVRSHRMSERVS